MAESQPMFAWYEDYASAESARKDAIREVVQRIEAQQRTIDRLLQACHSNATAALVDTFATVRGMFEQLKAEYQALATTFPADEYYRYHGMWRNPTQNLVFSASLLVYLEAERLVTLEEFQDMIGAQAKGQGFHIDLEDYLYGVCSLPSELARLATNCVTMGDFARPSKINAFVADVYNGFRLLNLKNDGLRKKFDSLKYDVKKIEGVIYDLSIRGLLPRE